jgi:hypothetical protein
VTFGAVSRRSLLPHGHPEGDQNHESPRHVAQIDAIDTPSSGRLAVEDFYRAREPLDRLDMLAGSHLAIGLSPRTPCSRHPELRYSSTLRKCGRTYAAVSLLPLTGVGCPPALPGLIEAVLTQSVEASFRAMAIAWLPKLEKGLKVSTGNDSAAAADCHADHLEHAPSYWMTVKQS